MNYLLGNKLGGICTRKTIESGIAISEEVLKSQIFCLNWEHRSGGVIWHWNHEMGVTFRMENYRKYFHIEE